MKRGICMVINCLPTGCLLVVRKEKNDNSDNTMENEAMV